MKAQGDSRPVTAPAALVHKAVLRLMERHGVDDEEAYRLLRKESMRQRVTVEELAVRVLATAAVRCERAQDRDT